MAHSEFKEPLKKNGLSLFKNTWTKWKNSKIVFVKKNGSCTISAFRCLLLQEVRQRPMTTRRRKRKRSSFDDVLEMDVRDSSVPHGSAGYANGTVVQSASQSKDRHTMLPTSVRRKMWRLPSSSRKTVSRVRNAANSLRNRLVATKCSVLAVRHPSHGSLVKSSHPVRFTILTTTNGCAAQAVPFHAIPPMFLVVASQAHGNSSDFRVA